VLIGSPAVALDGVWLKLACDSCAGQGPKLAPQTF